MPCMNSAGEEGDYALSRIKGCVGACRGTAAPKVLFVVRREMLEHR